MTISPKELEKLAHLAYLEADSKQADALAKEVSSIIDFVDQLQSVDTKGIAPLFHPLALYQRARLDEVTESDCIAELEEIATKFEDNLFLVPKVINSGK